VAQRLVVRELLAVAQAYSAVYTLAGFRVLSQRGLNLSTENLGHVQQAADKFLRVSKALAKRVLSRKEQREFDAFLKGAASQKPKPSVGPSEPPKTSTS
jgi:hypothetical protein